MPKKSVSRTYALVPRWTISRSAVPPMAEYKIEGGEIVAN